MEHSRRFLPPLLIVLSLVAAACTSAPSVTPTLPAATFTPVIAPTTAPTARPTATVTLLPVPTIAPTPVAPPLATLPSQSGCANRYTFVSDVSIPDDTHIAPGQVFTKTWQVRNTGTCTWGDGYVLAFSSGQAMTTISSIPVPRTPPDATVDLSVLLTAPTAPGTYQGFWVIKNPQGVSLTPHMWVKIIVP